MQTPEIVTKMHSQSPFFSHKYQLTLPDMQPIQTSLAYDNTLVILTRQSSTGRSLLLHYNKEGQLLNKFNIQNNSINFQMLKDDEVIVDNVPNYSIEVISLRTGERTDIIDTDSEDSQLWPVMVFPQTQMICLADYSCLEEEKESLRLRYYNYGGAFSDSELLYQTQQIYQNRWIQQCKKINNQSKVIWLLVNKEGPGIQAVIFELENKKQGIIQTIDIECYDCRIIQNILWEIGSQEYLFAYQREIIKYIEKYGVSNFKTNSLQLIHVEKMNQNEQVTLCNQSVIRLKNQIVVLTSFRYGKARHMLAYETITLDPKTGQILGRRLIENEANRNIELFSVGWDSNLMCEQLSKYQKSKTGEETLLEITIINTSKLTKEIYMHILEHIYDDFDQDLLQDAVELLVDEE